MSANRPESSGWPPETVDYFADRACAFLGAAEVAMDALFSFAGRPAPADKEAFDAAAENAWNATMDAVMALYTLQDPGRFAPQTWAARLGSVPQGPAPGHLTGRAALRIFREKWHVLRRAIGEFSGKASSARRAAWGAVGTAEPPHDALGRPALDATRGYNGTFGVLALDALSMLKTMSLQSRPVRRRLAECPAWLDDVAQCALILPDFWEFFFARFAGPLDGSSESRAGQVGFDLDVTVGLLCSVLNDNPRPWFAHTRATEEAGTVSAASVLIRGLNRIWETYQHYAQNRAEGGAKVSNLVASIGFYAEVLDIATRKKTGPSGRDIWTIGDRADGDMPDGCDRCGAEGEPLLRCSGCKVTRYCGTACQREAWKEHKAICRQWT